MPKKSAGILLYKIINNSLEVFLVHPGGPFYEKKDLGAWSVPKGEFDDDENALDAAKREFKEETGQDISGEFIELSPITQKNRKVVYAWVVEGDIKADEIKSNMFELEWPPKSGRKKAFPEIDKGQWFPTSAAKEKINPAQAELIDELINKINF